MIITGCLQAAASLHLPLITTLLYSAGLASLLFPLNLDLLILFHLPAGSPRRQCQHHQPSSRLAQYIEAILRLCIPSAFRRLRPPWHQSTLRQQYLCSSFTSPSGCSSLYPFFFFTSSLPTPSFRHPSSFAPPHLNTTLPPSFVFPPFLPPLQYKKTRKASSCFASRYGMIDRFYGTKTGPAHLKVAGVTALQSV
ncbi:hypothetical protein BDZ90DRAFT_40535 [Jaminaea rosea]|uniref:Uncharacterized protein n=1 Tax=Jaminaea rosea TaxID=1569628 RepID=A0A316UMR0_9BASI|nr:hypothetical protein BDZ90DRAFT_40535 [Jaminaea rosea]PWN26520.1 hypothetical protein BDZ90DRAFT_40535 [Jaminaea rosea]